MKNGRGEIQSVMVVAIYLDSAREWIGTNQIPTGRLVRIFDSNEMEVATISNAFTTIGSDLNRMGNSTRQARLKEGSKVVALYGMSREQVGFSKARRVPWLVAVGLTG